ncbi:helix-turn-helix domain-containing protein [Sulfitobacter donghicola]|uniref:AraC family transcriptional regulator n=1 Tax=Sulfitobacter donghicola DSW-25 = KCTC 12864 = JCM 14565 TaxID=1300350 RepID=A0A073IDB3_9RHOB|nr:AraC family transcriptional regulator [Sulfitobacter donghicola]KEJ88358.1 AraC family transcriptional regulator [Sulfitobacter donghicola DSW-25 = KCTC 12864 = JCM 14565]KIN69778.1 Transcriptional regulator, AraC family [Sulfitobacter donghicola DSW-25 = KCTC 12864 = JCM 14565]
MIATELAIKTLLQLGGNTQWRLGLAHDRPHHTLLWFTRGQGRILLDGRRRGLGTHNAVFIPADTLFSVDLGPQSLGQAVTIPVGTPLRLPDMARHLRIRDVHIQAELTALIEVAQREQSQSRPLAQDALEAHVALMSVWLRRQILEDEHIPERRTAGERLSARFAQMIPKHYTSGASMAFYATELGVTPTHLTRAVKTATGKTAAELLTERVVHAARDLLETTNHPARNIAQHLGFSSAAYFTRFMQQHAGHSPSQLRAPANSNRVKQLSG